MSQDLFLVEIVAYDPDISATRTLRYATGLGHVTGPAETPANTFYDPRVKQALSVSRSLFASGSTMGRSTTGFGDLVLLNGDRALDAFPTYGFDGRAITVRRGAPGAAYPSGFTASLVGTMQGVEVTQKEVTIKLRDRQAEMAVPIQTTKYAGSGLGTLEGVAGDLKGKPKPICYGKVFNIFPPCVETPKLIYQVHDAAVSTFDAVYDRGVALTAGAAYASTTDLLDNALAPAAGAYKTYAGAEGSYFRLGSTPDGQVTADITEGAAAANRYPAQLYLRLLTRAGKTSADWVAGDFTTLDTAAPYVAGFWTDQETQYANVFDQIAVSVGASWFIDKSNLFRIKQLLAPTGSTVASFTANDLVEPLLRILPNDPGQGLPSYQTIVRYKRVYTVQDVDLAAAVTIARREEVSSEWREAKAIDATVQTKNLLAVQIVEDSLLTVEADAQAEADRRQALRGVERSLYRLVVPLDATNAAIDLNDVVGLKHDRYGLSVVGGDDYTSFRVLGLQPNAEDRELTLTVWGAPPSSPANWVDDEGAFMVTDEGAYLVFES